MARRADQKGPASRLKVRFAPAWLSFLPAVWGDYWIVALDRDYRHAIVGDPSRKYLWILSRSSEMDATTYESLAAAAARLGFDTTRLALTPQLCLEARFAGPHPARWRPREFRGSYW